MFFAKGFYMVDLLAEKNKLFDELGLNDYYFYYYKRIDKGMNGGSKQSDIYDQVGYEEAEASLTDPVVSTCFYLSILPILRKNIVFKPIVEGKKSELKKSKEIADFLNFSLKKLGNGGPKQLIFDIMLMKHLGCTYIEKVYGVLSSSKYKGFTYYPRMKAKRNGLWDFSYDSLGNVNGYVSLLDKSIVYPVNKFISGSWLPTFNNPNGNGDFAKVWKFYDLKKQFLLFMLTKGAKIVKDRQIMLLGKEGSVGVQKDHTKILQQLINNNSCYIPAGYDVKEFTVDPDGAKFLLEIIREFDSQIARAYLGSSTIVNESTTGAGNYNTAQNNKDNAGLYQDYAEGLVKDILEEQYAKDLAELNFSKDTHPEDIYPTCELVDDVKFNADKEVAKDKLLKDLGILDVDTETDMNYLREKYNLPENDELFAVLEMKKEEAMNNTSTNSIDTTNNADLASMYE